MRLSENCLVYYERNKYKIYVFRVLIGIVLSCMFIQYHQHTEQILWVIAIVWIIVPLYLVYNHYRCGWNLILLHLLTSYRYMIPVLLMNLFGITEILLLCYLMYPFPTIIQQCVSGKFGVKVAVIERYILHDYNQRYKFRVQYYLYLLTVTFLWVAINGWQYAVNLIVPMYFLVIRYAMYAKSR